METLELLCKHYGIFRCFEIRLVFGLKVRRLYIMKKIYDKIC